MNPIYDDTLRYHRCPNKKTPTDQSLKRWFSPAAARLLWKRIRPLVRDRVVSLCTARRPLGMADETGGRRPALALTPELLLRDFWGKEPEQLSFA